MSDCQAGSPVLCDDENACTDDACNEASDACEYSCNATGVGDPCCLDPVCDGDPVCEGVGCTDNDGDGYYAEGGECGPVDCNDEVAAINPGAAEACNGVDDNCDDLLDPGEADEDGDGIMICKGDCDDSDPDIYPGAPETPGDGVDSNCNGNDDCFIATAAFGSAIEPQVELLRDFRDQVLMTNAPGRWFVDLYYTYSPPVARTIAQSGWLKAVVRTLLLPVIGIASIFV